MITSAEIKINLQTCSLFCFINGRLAKKKVVSGKTVSLYMYTLLSVVHPGFF